LPKYRINRISEEVKREVSDIIRNEIKDPRIASLCSVIDAEVTPDLRFAKIFISVLGSEEEKASTIKGLNSAAGFIRKELGGRIDLRYYPELHFELDNSIEHGARIMQILNEVNKKNGGETP
jgi:ribosome-binding factor A